MDFSKLLAESFEGIFVVEPNELTEIHVDYGAGTIWVLRYRTAKQLTPYKKAVFNSLYGMFGKPTVEDKFNQIISEFK